MDTEAKERNWPYHVQLREDVEFFSEWDRTQQALWKKVDITDLEKINLAMILESLPLNILCYFTI